MIPPTINCMLDTDAVIDLLRGVPSSVAFIRNLSDAAYTLYLCELTVAELFSHLTAEERLRVQAPLEAIPCLQTGEKASRQAGIWTQEYRSRGVHLPLSTALVAATAAWYNSILVTGNPDAYPMPDLRVLALPRA